MSKIKSRFEKVIFHCREQVSKNGISYYPAFPVDSNSSQDAAMNWAVGYYGYGPKTSQTGKSFNCDNIKGFTNPYILEIESRDQGGRSYKVILTDDDGNKFLVDMREPAIFDVISNSKIERNLLYGEFVFIKNGSQTNLVRKDSEAHRKFIEVVGTKETPVEKIKPVTKSKLEIGKVYSGGIKMDTIYIYLGKTFKNIDGANVDEMQLFAKADLSNGQLYNMNYETHKNKTVYPLNESVKVHIIGKESHIQNSCYSNYIHIMKGSNPSPPYTMYLSKPNLLSNFLKRYIDEAPKFPVERGFLFNIVTRTQAQHQKYQSDLNEHRKKFAQEYDQLLNLHKLIK